VWTIRCCVHSFSSDCTALRVKIAFISAVRCLYIGWQWRNFFIPYSCFPAMMWGKLCEMFITVTSLSYSKTVIIQTFSYADEWHTLQKPAPENWRRFLARLSYNLVRNFSGARFWSRIEHVLFRDRIWRPCDQNTDLWLVSVQCCCFRSLEL